jgi:hypothetical protein
LRAASGGRGDGSTNSEKAVSALDEEPLLASLEDVLQAGRDGAGMEALLATAGGGGGEEEKEEGGEAGPTYGYAYQPPSQRARGGHDTNYGAGGGAYYGGGAGGGGGGLTFNESDFVLVDAHVLSSPALADINGDGHMEVRGVPCCLGAWVEEGLLDLDCVFVPVVDCFPLALPLLLRILSFPYFTSLNLHLTPFPLSPFPFPYLNGCCSTHTQLVFTVSYYFDKAEYAGRGADQLGADPDMYVAGGVVCWDLDDQRWAWTVHLDLTTALSKYVFFIYL